MVGLISQSPNYCISKEVVKNEWLSCFINNIYGLFNKVELERKRRRKRRNHVMKKKKRRKKKKKKKKKIKERREEEKIIKSYRVSLFI